MLEELKKYIDVLDCRDMGEWVDEKGMPSDHEGARGVVYWDVVYRFADQIY